jgi:hypothetical protein
MDSYSILLNEEQFKKTSKKLLSNIKLIKNKDLQLSDIQEALSKSLGFRSLHDLQNTFNKQKLELHNQSTNKKNTSILENNNASDIIKLFMSLDIELSQSMWGLRATKLISVIIHILTWQRDTENLKITIPLIRKHLHLDTLITLYKTIKFPTNIQIELKNFLLSIPGYQENISKQSQTTYDQYSYLDMQLLRSLTKFEIIENSDIVLFRHEWVWGKQNQFILHPHLKNVDYIEYSWLYNECFQEIILSIISKKAFKEFTLHDLLNYRMNMINYNKNIELDNLISNIINNYDNSLKLSENIILLELN